MRRSKIEVLARALAASLVKRPAKPAPPKPAPAPAPAPEPIAAAPPKPSPVVHHRFKIQKRVDVTATLRPNAAPTKLGKWHTVSQADTLTAAEIILKGHRIDDRRSTFRVAEQWPPTAEPKTVL